MQTVVMKKRCTKQRSLPDSGGSSDVGGSDSAGVDRAFKSSVGVTARHTHLCVRAGAGHEAGRDVGDGAWGRALGHTTAHHVACGDHTGENGAFCSCPAYINTVRDGWKKAMIGWQWTTAEAGASRREGEEERVGRGGWNRGKEEANPTVNETTEAAARCLKVWLNGAHGC